MMITQVSFVGKEKELEMYIAGDIGKSYKEDGVWYIACSWCGCRYRMTDHAVVAVGGYITIRPLLLCTNEKCNARFYVNSGMISYV